MEYKNAVVLHNIRSAHNVGSIFRTADAAGAEHVYITGYTPRPTDRFNRAQPHIAKTALGAETSVAWSARTRIAECVAALKKDGWRVVGVEQDVRANDYRTLARTHDTVFVFGNEVRGLSRSVREMCDELIEIPMQGSKESLNVAVAAGIILFGTAAKR